MDVQEVTFCARELRAAASAATRCAHVCTAACCGTRAVDFPRVTSGRAWLQHDSFNVGPNPSQFPFDVFIAAI